MKEGKGERNMTLIELIKKIEKLNKANRELDFEEKTISLKIKDYTEYEIKTMKDLKKMMKEENWEQEEQEVLETKQLNKVDSYEYTLNEIYYIGDYDFTMGLRMIIK